jgi:hypothetical protein
MIHAASHVRRRAIVAAVMVEEEISERRKEHEVATHSRCVTVTYSAPNDAAAVARGDIIMDISASNKLRCNI